MGLGYGAFDLDFRCFSSHSLEGPWQISDKIHRVWSGLNKHDFGTGSGSIFRVQVDGYTHSFVSICFVLSELSTRTIVPHERLFWLIRSYIHCPQLWRGLRWADGFYQCSSWLHLRSSCLCICWILHWENLVGDGSRHDNSTSFHTSGAE